MSSRLPDTELCNLAFLPPEEKQRHLIAFEKPKQIKGTYQPFRKVFPDAINLQFPLFGSTLQLANLEAIKARLALECRGSEAVLSMNVAIAEATFAYAIQHGIEATQIDVVSLGFSGIANHEFGLNLLIRYRDHAAIVFLDLRRTNGLSHSGRQFMFSALHQRFRIAYPDLSAAQLEIWCYRNNKDRTLVCINEPSTYFDFADMEVDVAETYAIWNAIKIAEEPKRRASGNGRPTPFGF
ncbi:type VI toxin-antitoxin system SocB family DNA replication inhibitor toxin [Novosphingobium cyanobacteriorum]|uniref:Uncharacterized protein n=1 Tax=Novosphingobium cyanobacteriorum TaxID=3024215 RepID=A0ABT6CHW6_9SPHN|nr:hypothetical protein [Novosphingobium cyanobacteriorum]MDF8333517.1 hypothetical protein [Novosphingobium cyanobacteriorum]